MLNEFQIEVDKILVPMGFSIIENPTIPPFVSPMTDTNLLKYAKVWGRRVKVGKNTNPITYRAYAINGNPILLQFVKKIGNKIVKIASEQMTDIFDLEESVKQWGLQLGRKDIICNKCQEGLYKIGTKQGKPILVRCNRCGGKGWQNFNNQKANEAYDYVLNKRQEQYNDELILKPHWRPYPNGHAPR